MLITINSINVVYANYNLKLMIGINSQLLQQHNPWWYREEMILDDEKIRDYEKMKYRYIPPILSRFPDNTDAVLTLRGPRQVGKSTSIKLLTHC